jgi:hypothetical protein
VRRLDKRRASWKHNHIQHDTLGRRENSRNAGLTAPFLSAAHFIHLTPAAPHLLPDKETPRLALEATSPKVASFPSSRGVLLSFPPFVDDEQLRHLATPMPT